MSTLNFIGLDQQEADKLATGLNKLLANFQVYYQNLRALHWNISGTNFFELHVKFEELYTDAQEKIDMIAERVLTLGSTPAHTFSDYLETSEIREGKDISTDRASVELILESLSVLLTIERQLLEQAGAADDEGSASLLSDFIAEQEKTVWMLRAWSHNA